MKQECVLPLTLIPLEDSCFSKYPQLETPLTYPHFQSSLTYQRLTSRSQISNNEFCVETGCRGIHTCGANGSSGIEKKVLGRPVQQESVILHFSSDWVNDVRLRNAHTSLTTYQCTSQREKTLIHSVLFLALHI